MDSDNAVQETIYSCAHCGEELAGWLPCDCDAETTITIEMTGESLVRITLNCEDTQLKVVTSPAEARKLAILLLQEADRADELFVRLWGRNRNVGR